MGLEWKHINFDKGSIRIEQASQYLSGYGIFTKEPKNESSKREVSIPDSVIAMLKDYKIKQNEERLKFGSKWQESDQLFTNWDGRPGYVGWPGKWFHQFLIRNELEAVPFHSLRHLSATMLINAEVQLKNISSRLWHTDIVKTSNIYDHVLKSADKEAAEKLESKLFGRLLN